MPCLNDLVNLVSSGSSPRRGLPTFLSSHGYDVALKVALEDAPRALIDHERRLVRHPRIHIGFGDDPRRSVRYSLRESRIHSNSVLRRQRTHQVEDLALSHQVVQAIHDFLDAARPVPLEAICVFDTDTLHRDVECLPSERRECLYSPCEAF